MTFEQIIKIYTDFGAMVLLGLLVIWFVVIPKMKSAKKQEEVNNKVYEKKMLGDDEKKTLIEECSIETTLKTHSFFCDMMYEMNDGYNDIDFGGKTRNMLFRDMWITKCRVLNDGMLKFSKINFDNDNDWYVAITKGIKDVIEIYEKEWRLMGVPELCISKFNEWHQRRVEVVYEGLEDTFRARQVPPSKKTIIILDMLKWIMKMGKIDLTGSAYELNGELTGIIYKQSKIEPLKH